MTIFTFIHVVLSLIGIASGLVVLRGLLASNPMNRWTSTFLAATVATSITGFLFPFHGVTPATVLGILSLVVLAAAVAGRYMFRLAGPWRWVYAAGSVMALYFNVFVLIVQAFEKISALRAMAPTTPPSGPAFAAVQGVALVFFAVMGVLAVGRFRAAG
ncbi:MAG: hypothetical protein ACYC8V_01355 [Caulobacteraceae bacterium]